MNKILKEFTKQPITVLCCPTHESYQTNMAKVPVEYIMWDCPKVRKKWHSEFREIPSNFRYVKNLTADLIANIDIVLSQNPYDQYPVLSAFANQYKKPLIQLTHTSCSLWPEKSVEQHYNNTPANIQVLITDYSKREWGYMNDPNARVINHMIDTNIFKSVYSSTKSKNLLSVCNDYAERDSECGFTLWKKITKDLGTTLVGTSNSGVSKPAKDIDDLVGKYQNHLLFLNTSLSSPCPMSVLEAMSCGLVVVSTATNELPNIIDHGKNGFLYHPDRPEDARAIIDQLLEFPPKHLVQIGQNARKTIEEKFNEQQFVDNWEKVFKNAAG